MKLNKNFKTRGSWSKRLLYALIISIGCCFNSQAQQGIVTGTVTSSEDGMPIPGVAVLIKDTTIGGVTDFDGNYNIKAEMGNILVFTYLGMKPQEIIVSKSEHNMVLDPSTESLDEIVISIGYGTVKKKELTGAAAHVKSEDIEQFVTSDLGSALQGQISGVNITSASGEPGEAASLQIRGVTSLLGSNEPLWVVDGIAQQGNPGLSPNEIETIDVLKDAASAAVYGTEGAGGVILVTTKKGQEGRMSATFNTSYGVQTLGDGIPLMNTKETLFFSTTQLDNGASTFIPGPYRYPEWLNNDNTFDDYVLVNGASTKQHTLNLSGGTKDFSYNGVVGYFNQDGTIVNSNFERINGRISAAYNSDNWKINGSVAFTTEKQDKTSGSLIANAQRYSPFFPIVDQDSDVIYSSTPDDGGVNTPLELFARSLKSKNNRTKDRINASLGITRKLGENLSFITTVGSAIVDSYSNQFSPAYTIVYADGSPSETDPLKSGVEVSSSRLTTLSADATLKYQKKFGKHNVGAQATFAVKEGGYEGFSASKDGVLDNSISVLDGASINAVADSDSNYNFSQIGMLARVTYSYKGTYLFSGLVRRDASSKFSPDNQWGTFPSVSVGWNVSDEKFWKPLKGTINKFKLRSGVGTVGNNRFSDYAYQSTIQRNSNYIFDTTDAVLTNGAAIYNYANPEVKWETKTEVNVGFDMSFLKNKINLSVDYYSSENKDMLFPLRTPVSAGAYDGNNLSTILNVGNMSNEGLEIALGYRTKIGESKLSTNFTFSKNENEITSTAGQSTIYNTRSTVRSTPLTVFSKGYEAGSYFLYQNNGAINDEAQLAEYQKFPSKINAQLGDMEIIDADGNGVIDNNDRVYSGSALPDFEIGWNLQWKYKNFDFGMNWFASVGSEIINANKSETYFRGRHKDLVNMWSVDNPTSTIPILRDFGTDNYELNTDYWVENGDYLRLKLVTFGYSLPNDITEKIGLTNLRMYLSAQNPLTISNYSGYDPEIGGSVERRGIDSSRYPLTALYTLGLNVKF